VKSPTTVIFVPAWFLPQFESASYSDCESNDLSSDEESNRPCARTLTSCRVDEVKAKADEEGLHSAAPEAGWFPVVPGWFPEPLL